MFRSLHNRKAKIIYDVRSPWIDMSVERGFINKWIVPFYRWTLYREEKFLCRRVDSFIFITDGLKSYYVKQCKLKNKNVLVSPTGIDLKKFKRTKTDIREKFGVKKDEILIGSVGGIAKIRKLEEFLDIFNKIVSKNKNIKLMFIGEGDLLEELKKKTKELKLEKNVIFVGSVPHKEVPKYLSAFDFGLCHLPNIAVYENSFPLKVLEYLACGVPVLASELKTHFEISKKLNGVYVYRNAEDILKIATKRSGAVKVDLKDFDWRNIATEYEKVWRGR